MGIKICFPSFIILLQLCACNDLIHEKGNGNLISEEREVEGFSAIDLRGNYQIFLNQGSDPGLMIETDENLLELIETDVKDGVLRVENSKKISSKKGVKIFITFSSLDKISSAGASVVKTESLLEAQTLEVSLPGAGILDLQLEVQDLEIVVAGAGLVKLEGWAQHQEIKMSGIGNLEAYDMRSRTCNVTVTGVGSAQVNVSEALTASIKGMGGIKYKGNPISVNESISGLGKIENADNDAI